VIKRLRKDEEAVKRDSSFTYRVCIHDDIENLPDLPVCTKTFCAIYSITKNKLKYLQKNMKITGQASRDMRGKHSKLYTKLNKKTER